MSSANKILVFAAFLGLFLSACSIQSKKSEEKKGDKVDIDSPIGSMHVATNEHVKAPDTGLPIYPGAREAAPEEHDNTSKANVNLGFAGFGLKVVAAKYESDDSADKLKDFYRKALSKYGEVVECRGDLDLDYGKDGKSVKCESSKSEPDKYEMGVGKGDAQHVVSIRPRGKATQFALIYIQTRGKERETM
ncbi:MAG TPA: hypothetical protein VMS96_02920 [Terriglobales bacterium]|nr:hypothetical protein [Terriglobales bacterium]